MSDKQIDDLFNANAIPTKTKGKKAATKKAAAPAPAAVSEPPVAETAPAAAPVQIAPLPKKLSPKDTVSIILDEVEGENNYVFLGHNGKHYQLQRGVVVQVPRFLMDVLNSCEATRYTPVVNPDTGQRELQARKYLRFPYRVV